MRFKNGDKIGNDCYDEKSNTWGPAWCTKYGKAAVVPTSDVQVGAAATGTGSPLNKQGDRTVVISVAASGKYKDGDKIGEDCYNSKSNTWGKENCKKAGGAAGISSFNNKINVAATNLQENMVASIRNAVEPNILGTRKNNTFANATGTI